MIINTKKVGGIPPSGTINITDTNVTDVTQYATAQVVDADLVAENIKKDVNILGVVGEFEGGGGATENEVVIATDISISTDTFNAIFAGVTFHPNSIYCCYWKGIKTNATPITDQFGYCVFYTDTNGARKAAPYTRFRNNDWSGVTGLATNYNGSASANDVYVWLKVG